MAEEAFHGRRTCGIQRQSLVLARRDEHRDLHVHTDLSVSEVPGGDINALLFQVTLVVMGVATFSLVFASLYY